MERLLLRLILVLFVLLGLIYAFTTPVFEASDELWHYPMVRHLADGNPLPVQDPNNVGPWKQQASQPPLYYYLGAALTFWIDTADMAEVRRLNPHVDNGVITEDGNINLVVHDPAANPWQGTLLAVYLIRVVSVFLGAATVYLTYRIGRELAPERPEIGLGAAAVNGFMPMFLFISGAVNNDNLVVPLISLALLMMIRMVREVKPASSLSEAPIAQRQLLLLGVVAGLAALAKYPGLALLPMALGTLFIARWKAWPKVTLPALLQQFGRTVLDWLLVVLPFTLIAGWWYWRNKQLYGDWLGWSAFFQVLGVRATPASLAQLWDERWGFMLSYWGLFGGVNVPMAGWIYVILNSVAVLAAVGFLVYVLREMRHWCWRPRTLQSFLTRFLLGVVAYFPLVVCLIWSAATVAGLIRWATTTWSSQGRLVFAAISPLSSLLVLGLVGWLPARTASQRSASRALTGGLGTFLFAVAALAPFLWIQPAYRPAHYRPEDVVGPLRPVNAVFDQKLRLVGYQLRESTIEPGEALDLLLTWETLAPMEQDWSVFVHLVDPILGVPIAQRDMFTRQGLRPTSLLPTGERFVDYYRLTVPETAVAPAELELTVGLYDFQTGQRLPLAEGAETATLTRLPLRSAPGETPNPVQVRFEDQLTLVGYNLAPRRAESGETLELTLYWRPQRALTADYTFFAQVVDRDTTRWASHDFAPPEGTSNWPADQLQRLTLPLTLAPETPAGVYPVIIGIYTRTADGGFDRLQLITAEGRLTDDFLTLTPVRVGP